jgi:serine/threonine-protein kinase RsbW
MTQRKAMPPDWACVELPNQRPEIERLVQDVLDQLAQHHYSDAARFAIRLAIEEAVSNAFHHGHRGLPSHTPVTVRFRVSPREVEILVRDQGPGFNPESVPDPTLDQNIEVPSGRGLLLMRAYMAEVDYIAPGNEVRMVYRKPGR